MCERKRSLTDPTANFVLSDLLTATEDLIDFAINVFDALRLQFFFNDRNRRINLAMQLKDANDAQTTEFGFVGVPTRPCAVATTLKYDFAFYLERILQACKRSKANLMLFRVVRTRPGPTNFLIVASSNVRVGQLNRKVQFLARLIKDNGGQFPNKKKRKKKDVSSNKPDENENTEASAAKIENKRSTPKNKPPATMTKEDLDDYVEITLGFRMIITKYHEFIQQIRNMARSGLSFNGQAVVTNAITIIPIAANAINELNHILNRLLRIAHTIEAESSSIRQPPIESMANENKELYRQNVTDRESQRKMFSSERIGVSRSTSPRPIEAVRSQKDGFLSGSSLKRNNISLLKQDETRGNTRNQSAVASLSTLATISSSGSALKITPNIIANIFEDFFINTDDLFD